uniref:carotenoid biosynthesis protein n=1 Tax=Chitinophaga vietnamensis TaxID=2593957 RepID=UPI001375726E|nr:carotenoid biosynthesis protein [Chitinophaga vietnamensis]
MYLLLIICGWHAFKKGVGHVSWLLGGLGFGLLLEYVNVATNSGYVYGRFTVMLGHAPHDIPLCIGCGWAVIIYSSRLFSDKFGLPLWSAAALDSLLALNIDLSMDVVAYRLHMWHWDWANRGFPDQTLTGQWFGVPYGNFYGWLLVVFYYSWFGRLLEKIRFHKLASSNSWKALLPLLSILLSQLALWISLFPLARLLQSTVGITSKHRLIAVLLLFALLVAIGFRKKHAPLSGRFPLAAWIVPAWFHMYFFVWLFLGGFAAENKWMTIFAVINFLIGIVVHAPVFVTKDKRTLTISHSAR